MDDSPATSPQLEHLLQQAGIASTYLNYAGETVAIPLPNRLGILAAMGYGVATAGDVARQLQQCRQDQYANLSPAAQVLRADHGGHCPLYLPDDFLSHPLRWELQTESGARHAGQCLGSELAATDQSPIELSPDHRINIRLLPLPTLPAGYHQLELECGPRQARCRLIAAPDRCHEADWVQQGRRQAGLSVQLYSLRSARNWGMGDFSDLMELVRLAAAAGIHFVVLNPLHSLDLAHPEQCSPYSPMDRRFLNPLYIDPTIEPEFMANPALQSYFLKPAFQERLAALREDALVDYRSVARLKLVVLGKMYKQFCRITLGQDNERSHDYQRWVATKGEALQQYSRFEAARFRFAMDQSRHTGFHCYLQWLAESQLEACQQAAVAAGMTIGLVRDLAVGGNRGSAEVQLNPGLFCPAASIGAPPDPLAPQGQKWGLPPLHPQALAHEGFRHYIQLLDSNMEHCGALRIDHVMSLLRLWWCPAQGESANGAYVYYPADTLFAILRLESRRRRCAIIGEDLGVVPPEIRRHMHDSGLFSNALFYFEKYDPVHFKRPEHYPPRALAMIANHDVPTLAAWWGKADLALRQQIGLIPSPQALADAIGARDSDLIQILHWLKDQGRLPGNWHDFDIHRPLDAALCTAILQATGSSSSLLVSLQLEDLLLEKTPVNIPGTSSEYPNWQRKLAASTSQLFSDSESRTMLGVFVHARSNS